MKNGFNLSDHQTNNGIAMAISEAMSLLVINLTKN